LRLLTRSMSPRGPQTRPCVFPSRTSRWHWNCSCGACWDWSDQAWNACYLCTVLLEVNRLLFCDSSELMIFLRFYELPLCMLIKTIVPIVHKSCYLSGLQYSSCFQAASFSFINICSSLCLLVLFRACMYLLVDQNCFVWMCICCW
jgi:hypothetical protein